MVMKTFWKTVFVLGFLGLIHSAALAAEPARDWYVTPKLGISAFTGILGLEVQYKHLAFDVGYPTSGGVRYYFRPERHSWFFGLYGTGLGYNDDNTKDGITYTHYSKIEGGVGGGYRWFWHSRWSLELGLTIGAGNQNWTSNAVERTEHDVFFTPVAAFGVAF
jgi:hypothetical protein